MLSFGEAAIYLIKKTIIIHSAIHLTVVVIVFVKFCRFKSLRVWVHLPAMESN